MIFILDSFEPIKISFAIKLGDNIKAVELLRLIPDDEFASLIKLTDVDYQVKKLYGRNVFYLLLYGLLESTRISLRSLEDIYNTSKFRILFNIKTDHTIKYNSVSVRLANMNVNFFEKVYKLIYKQFSKVYNEQEAIKYRITRVDSTMVAEAANKIEEGMVVGVKKDGGKKQIKYTISLTDILPSSVEVFSEQNALSEDYAIPRAILNNLDKRKDNIFVFDRGVRSRECLCEFDNNKLKFVTRIREIARHEILESYTIKQNIIGNLKIESDQKVYLFNKHRKVEHPFRLIKTMNERNVPLWFLTNHFELGLDEVVNIYKKRWDIEVFFRFIKQELNFKHFLSTNINGIKIILYMTLILAMLILLYKNYNEVGFKTAKRRFYYEIEELLMKIMINMSGGDPKLVFR